MEVFELRASYYYLSIWIILISFIILLGFLKSTVITEKSFVFGEYSTLFLLKIHFIPKI